jgi:acyl carrier protein
MSQSEILSFLLDVIRDLTLNHDVSPDDSFFLLGGDSILARKLSEHIFERFQKVVPAEQFYTFSSIQETAECIQRL